MGSGSQRLDDGELPFCSVIIPMRNEEAHITPCIESVLMQDYPRDRMEVLVVDGQSDDRSREVIGAIAARDPRLRLLDNPSRIVPTALNIGIRAARGDVIVRVDGHTALEPDYIREGVAALARSGADNVGGPMVARGGGSIGDAVALATSSPFGIGAYFHFGTEERFVDTVYMGMWPKAVFARVGLFDPELVRNQDDEFNYRLRKLGGRVFITPRMRSSYQNRTSLRALVRQFYQYGVWKVRVCQKHPKQMSWRHLVPPALVLTLVFTVPCWLLFRPLGIAGVAAAAVYAAVLGYASWHTARRAGDKQTAMLPLVFGAIHLSWGAGFLVGMLRYRSQWLKAEPTPPQLAGDTAGVRASEGQKA